MSKEDLVKQNTQSLVKPKQSIIQKLNRQSKALLVDTSGSMSSIVNDKTKMDLVNDILSKISRTGFRLFKFSDSCKEIFDLYRFSPEYGTQMDRAFTTLKLSGVKECTLLTDGLPDDSEAAIRTSQGLKINIIYIGPKPAPQFLDDLAKQTGGSFQNQDLLLVSASKELENKIRLLLT